MKYILLISLLMFSSAALAAEGHQMGHGQAAGEATQEYMKVMDAMHGPMMKGIMDPDPDTAFVKGMLPHHEGAVDMAKIQLKYGKDPELRKLAQTIIEAQESEIRFMENWLKSKQQK